MDTNPLGVGLMNLLCADSGTPAVLPVIDSPTTVATPLAESVGSASVGLSQLTAAFKSVAEVDSAVEGKLVVVLL